jgi:hypothetical protein
MVNPGSRVMNVSSTDHVLVVDLEDGRTISVPLAWYPRLLHASQKTVMTGKSPVGVLAFTGRLLMRISA